jgi:NADH:ubiquinone oxidoreductase subunit 5 (subunit L)/multisubunit Na+/H+ antiporter MnhA subunit
MVHTEVTDIVKRVFLSPSFGITCAALAIGGYPAYKLYITRQADPVKLTQRHHFLRGVHDFLWNRCYIDALYHKIFADGTKRLSAVMYKYPELGGIDALNYFMANHVTSFCRRFRKTHTGTLSHNMLAVFIGIVLLMILLFFFGGHLS